MREVRLDKNYSAHAPPLARSPAARHLSRAPKGDVRTDTEGVTPEHDDAWLKHCVEWEGGQCRRMQWI